MSRLPFRLAVLGATSGIARATLPHLSAPRRPAFLTSREEGAARSVADVWRRTGGGEVTVRSLDITRAADRTAIVADLDAWAGSEPVLVLLAIGQLDGPTQDLLAVNFSGPIHLLDALTPALARRPGSHLAVLTSVAGVRGRSRLAAYGAAKGGMHRYLEGLRAEIQPGVAVTDLRPGPVDTAMTRGHNGLPLMVSAERAGRAVARAIRRQRAVAYIPGFWAPIAWTIRHLPRPVFDRLDL